jgi:aromatic ring-cleaving dioxygenase
VARRANNVEEFYVGDISSKASGKSNPASALNAWTRTLRHSSHQKKFEPFLIAFCVPSVASIKNRGGEVWLFDRGTLFATISVYVYTATWRSPFGIRRADLVQQQEASRRPFMNQREIEGYHAHIYYDPASREAAARVRAGLANFNVQLGSWHDEPVGPHPKAMYQALFANDEFARVVPWLMLNRQGLTVLVHPSTGDSYGDHLERSLWLGEVLKLRAEVLRRG